MPQGLESAASGEWISVASGWFEMGLDSSLDPEAEYEEGPVRRVWLPEFDIRKTPVTVAEWSAFTATAGFDWAGADEIRESQAGPDHPVTFVSWHDAQGFADWLTAESGEAVALPTEAQWEKACRGTDGRPYPWGHEKGDWLTEMATEPGRSYPVGRRPERASACGCLDMWANVSEWCLDWYDDEDREDLPREARNPAGPPAGEFKCFRGGSPADTGWPRCSFRGFQKPGFRHRGLGFRLVRSLRPPAR